MPTLPTSWSSPASRSDADLVGADPELRADEHRVPRHVLGVALGVAVLGVDGEDQALEHVEGVGRDDDLGLEAGDQDRVAAAGPGLAQRDRGVGEQLGHRVAVLGEPGDGAADRERQVVAVAEAEADVRERAGGRASVRRSSVPTALPVDRHEELVGAVAADRQRGRRQRLEQRLHRADRLVARGVAPGVVEDPEVVDVEDRDLEAAARSRGAARSPAPMVSTSAPWLSIPVNGSRRVASMSATVWLEIRSCAARKTRYSTPAAAIAAPTVTTITSRRAASIAAMIGVASRQTPTTPTTVAVLDAAAGTRGGRCRCRGRPGRPRSRPRPRARPPCWPASAVCQSAEFGTRSPAIGASLARIGPVEAPDLGPDDPARRDERLEAVLERRLPFGGDRRRGQVGGLEQVVDEAADDLGVGDDGLVQRRRRDVDRGQHDLRGGGHADDHEEDAVHEEQQDRPRLSPDLARRPDRRDGPPASPARLPIAVGTSRAPRSAENVEARTYARMRRTGDHLMVRSVRGGTGRATGDRQVL